MSEERGSADDVLRLVHDQGLDAARSALSELIAKTPEEAAKWFLLGRLFANMEQPSEDILRKALRDESSQQAEQYCDIFRMLEDAAGGKSAPASLTTLQTFLTQVDKYRHSDHGERDQKNPSAAPLALANIAKLESLSALFANSPAAFIPPITTESPPAAAGEAPSRATADSGLVAGLEDFLQKISQLKQEKPPAEESGQQEITAEAAIAPILQNSLVAGLEDFLQKMTKSKEHSTPAADEKTVKESPALANLENFFSLLQTRFGER